MKSHINYLFSCLILSNTIIAGTTMLDEILAILPHADGNILIYASDLRDIDGKARSFRDVVLDGLMELKARDLKIAASETTADAMINTMVKRYNITREQLLQIFEEQGYTPDEVPEALKRRSMVDSLMGALIRTEEPSKEAIEAYYQEHPTYDPARYTIELASISTHDITQKELDTLIATGKSSLTITWNEPESYTDEQLTREQDFVRTMKVGDIHLMGESEGSYDLIKLVAKEDRIVVPLTEAVAERISMMLRQKMFMKALGEFQDNLLKKARISFCQPEYAELLNQKSAPVYEG